MQASLYEACNLFPMCLQLADELKKYGLTLTNYASIREQSVGGFIQVRASLAACMLLK